MRRQALVSMVVAVLLTAAVTVPLALLASRGAGPARTDGLVLEIDGTVQPADEATVVAGALVTLRWVDDDILAATTTLFIDGQEAVSASETAGQPPLVLAVLDTGAFGPGRYEVLTTGTTSGGDEDQRAATFEVVPR